MGQERPQAPGRINLKTPEYKNNLVLIKGLELAAPSPKNPGNICQQKCEMSRQNLKYRFFDRKLLRIEQGGGRNNRQIEMFPWGGGLLQPVLELTRAFFDAWTLLRAVANADHFMTFSFFLFLPWRHDIPHEILSFGDLPFLVPMAWVLEMMEAHT